MLKAEKDLTELNSIKEAIIIRNQTITSLDKKIEEYKAYDKRNSDLETRESNVCEKERNLKITILETQLESEKSKSDFAKSIGLGLVRNIDYRKSVFDSENQSGYMNGNNYVLPTPINKHLTENQTAD